MHKELNIICILVVPKSGNIPKFIWCGKCYKYVEKENKGKCHKWLLKCKHLSHVDDLMWFVHY